MKKMMGLGLILIFFVYGCSGKCESGLVTKEGKCCTYACSDKVCSNGFVEGTCNCECAGSTANIPTNIGSIFDDSGDVEPPPIPN